MSVSYEGATIETFFRKSLVRNLIPMDTML